MSDRVDPSPGIRRAVLKKYAEVAADPAGRFPYPVGRDSARTLGYAPEWIDAVPAGVVEAFVGVGNPFRLQRPEPGWSVLDAGCGSGFDAFVAAALVGSSGRVVGLDLSPEMLARARAAWPPAWLEFIEGSLERLPFDDGFFDLVISNGVINLAPDKDAAYREIFRVLRPGGRFAAADLVQKKELPPEVLADPEAWST